MDVKIVTVILHEQVWSDTHIGAKEAKYSCKLMGSKLAVTWCIKRSVSNEKQLNEDFKPVSNHSESGGGRITAC